MANHTNNFAVDKFLCSGCTLLGVSCVIFGEQFKLDFFAADGNPLGVEFFNRKPGTVFIVFAQVCDRTARWSDMAKANHCFLCEGLLRNEPEQDGASKCMKFKHHDKAPLGCSNGFNEIEAINKRGTDMSP